MLKIDAIRNKPLEGEITLPGSKSIANRLLIMKALSGAEIDFRNLPNSNDVQVLDQIINSEEGDCFFEDAGTPLRLYLAFAALKGNQGGVIDGLPRLRERPIRPLLEALENCGARFHYLETAYCLPLKVAKTMDTSTTEVSVSATVSSQFISAMMLIGPYFDQGLSIRLIGELRSLPYIKMTMALMSGNGVRCEFENDCISIGAGNYLFNQVNVESDWSAAAFFYNFMAVGREGEILLKGLQKTSVQGDSYVSEIYRLFGVETEFVEEGVLIRCNGVIPEKIEIDVRDIPDMFPSLCATVVALRIPAKFKGVRNLRDKESDRINAMRQNCSSLGADFTEVSDDDLSIDYTSLPEKTIRINTFKDHRIAMACAVFAYQADLEMNDGEVVKKSFPEFWEMFNYLYGNLAKEITE
jgi:3-phosphoshikimate 1-carboxyvinyltransferase